MLLQLMATWALTTILVIVTDRTAFRSSWNAIWMIGLPFVVAYLTSRRDGAWPLIGLVLLILNTVLTCVTAALLGIGP